MTLPGQLDKLQQVDSELQKKRHLINDLFAQLSGNKAPAAAESRLSSQKQQLEERNKKQKDIEWELEDLQEKSNRLQNKLYGGTVKNPKELLPLKDEFEFIKKKIRTKEDLLLEVMGEVEDLQARTANSVEEVQEISQRWQQEQEVLNKEKGEAEDEFDNLSKARRELAEQINPETLKLYEQIKQTRGQAVARVEQGRCQGCYITLPTGQWQRVRGGELIQCSSCSRIRI